MVAAPGVGKAVATVADKAATTTAKTASKEQIGRFDAAMAKPDQTGAAAVTGQGGQTAGVAGSAVRSTGAPPGVATAARPAGGAPSGGPGDKILRGIDNMRETARHLTGSTALGSGQSVGPLANMSELMDTQKSLIGFEVETQVGGKGVQETNQAVQTLLKGQ